MVRTLLVRGLWAGLLAGLIAGGFAFAFGEPHVDSAIALEEAAAPPRPRTGRIIRTRIGRAGCPGVRRGGSA
ncbi:hypothetical protein GCM10020220_097890 [Nonomuraea rubra]|uniref:CbtA family protein n=1 Tax=Nonomuraea rubra TaxID=46180 RepID=UPI0031EB3A8C